ncbi:MAG: Flp pilus assembly complex ATPase component TadA [Nitrospirae bacterium]|uniref:ATPase, T2SS/T4P/T4SS family n=1 Tax=Candidatus Magnetobacterium casense TaxID=1455061 RepID=UPI000697FF32|nr:ATPase, T2SS/T4P/T4SS family [Candidatus Magnetobacterium casensis]MBF0338134.1 Flp pilus assembly complex ATPase component TadA [Nitrospirota bacterium]
MIVQGVKSKKPKKPLGEVLLEAGVINQIELSTALAEQKKTKHKLGKVLTDLGYTSEMEIVQCLAQNMGYDYRELDTEEIDKDLLQVLPARIAEKHLVFPLKTDGRAITIAMCDPLDVGAIKDISFVTGKNVSPVVSTLTEIRKAIQQHYHGKKMPKLGELLVEARILHPDQLNVCLEKQKTTKKKLGDIIVQLNLATEMDIARALSQQLNIPYVNLEKVGISDKALEMISRDIALANVLIPININKRAIEVAMANPMDSDAIREIKYIANRDVDVVLSTPKEIREAIRQYYAGILGNKVGEIILAEDFDELQGQYSRDKGKTEGILDIKSDRIEVAPDVGSLLAESESPPVIKLVNKILLTAIKSGASDIHLEPSEKDYSVRLRTDGIMVTLTHLSKALQNPTISRIKIMSKLDIAERRVPQDGGIKLRLDNKEVDLRVSTLPTHYGEKIVMRVLDPTAANLSIHEIGLNAKDHTAVVSMIDKPQGIVLVTGPTGSGKSSTLYAALNHILNDKINIITLENPVEYSVKGITQVNINEKVGLTFSSSLRAVLRQDPDVIMVGEMRDPETAEIAIQASITGHLVLSTLHTTTAVGAVTRLKGMGIKSYFLASSLNGVIAQRLVRKLCNHCKVQYEPSDEELLFLMVKGTIDPSVARFYKPAGCSSCGNTGYRGRVGIFEILSVNSLIRKIIYDDSSTENAFARAATESGMNSLREDGLKKIMMGITSVEEVLRVTAAIAEGEIVVCSKCREPLSSEYTFCPYCSTGLKHKCPKCGMQRNEQWKFCPFCNETFAQ